MALLWADGFDHYNANVLNKWNGNSLTGVTFGGPGPFGYGQYLQCGTNASPGQIFKVIPAGSQSAVVMGCRVYGGNGKDAQCGVFGCSNGTTMINYVYVDALGAIHFNNGSTEPYVSANGLVLPLTYTYIEMSVTLATGATGSVTITVNGGTPVTTSSIITGTATTTPAVALYGTVGGSNSRWDDFYCTGATTYGPIKIYPLYPAGRGNATAFSVVGAATNWQAEATSPPNAGIYVFDSTVSDIDTYELTALPALTTVVESVQANAFAYSDNAGSRTLSVGVGNGSTESFDAGTVLPGSPVFITRQMTINPITSSPWAVADFTGGSALESGLKVVA